MRSKTAVKTAENYKRSGHKAKVNEKLMSPENGEG